MTLADPIERVVGQVGVGIALAIFAEPLQGEIEVAAQVVLVSAAVKLRRFRRHAGRQHRGARGCRRYRRTVRADRRRSLASRSQLVGERFEALVGGIQVGLQPLHLVAELLELGDDVGVRLEHLGVLLGQPLAHGLEVLLAGGLLAELVDLPRDIGDLAVEEFHVAGGDAAHHDDGEGQDEEGSHRAIS